MLIPRIITAVFLVAFMLGGLFYLPAPYWPAFAAVIILPALWEWTRLFHITGLAQVGYLGFSALMMYAVASTGQMPGAGMQVLSLLMWLVVAPLWLWRRWKLVDRNQAAMLGWLLLMPAWFALLAWRPGPEQGPALLAVMALVWIADTAAYFAGRAFGKHKLAPAISPG
jgi:phosphatidate cytidylyltransferase